jgi:hypothetical protein
MSRLWTFEELAQADAETLEQTLIASTLPDFNELEGYGYNGFNCAPAHMMPLPARKFRKVFFQKAGISYGLNQFVSPDDDDFTGEWRIRLEDGKPVESGFFRVGAVSEQASTERFVPYRHLVSLDYNVAPNPRWNFVMRSIYDLIGLPNVGDYGVILGKAYLRLLPGWTVFATYFVLGHRSPYTRG